MSWVHRTIVVPAEHATFARALAVNLAGASAEGMWNVPVSINGKLPSTHYISSGLITEDFIGLLEKPALCAQLAQSSGFEASAKEVADLIQASDITDEPALSALQRLGLTIVTGDV